MNRTRVPRVLGAAVLLAVVVSVLPAAEIAAAETAAAEVVGGRGFYFCAAFQAVKIVGLFTANAALVVGGAIGGGLACGMGW